VVLNGSPVARPTVPSGSQTIFGKGSPLRFVVLGDSTSVSQGGEYSRGYAVQTAEYLAQRTTVTWANVGVSGARAKDVAEKQVPQVLKYKPDIALVAVGANDVTHGTPVMAVKKSLSVTIDQLRQANPKVHIILTGAPDMGSVPRFPQPLRWYMGARTNALNKMVTRLSKEKHVAFAPIAEKTGQAFRANPKLFAADKFHPTTEGYELWVPVIIAALPET
jgi:lysophospholipase L1-like esterase